MLCIPKIQSVYNNSKETVEVYHIENVLMACDLEVNVIHCVVNITYLTELSYLPHSTRVITRSPPL